MLRPFRGRRRQGFHVLDEDVFTVQRGQQLFVPAAVLQGDQFAGALAAGGEGLGRRHVVGTNHARLAFDLLLEPGDTDFEELVQVGAEDREELHPFEQRLKRVEGFLQHAVVELQPAQLSVQEVLGAVEIRLGGRIGHNRLSRKAELLPFSPPEKGRKSFLPENSHAIGSPGSRISPCCLRPGGEVTRWRCSRSDQPAPGGSWAVHHCSGCRGSWPSPEQIQHGARDFLGGDGGHATQVQRTFA